MKADKLKTLYVTDRKDWRAWLERYFDREDEVWLVYPRRSSGRTRIAYNHAVEEALCFGWIDSQVRAIDPENSAQRFSPRRPGSAFSQPNKERLKWLLREGLLHPSMEETARQVAKERFTFPSDIIEAIKEDKQAWANYRKFSPSYRRIRVAYIDAARSRPDEFIKRLKNFIEKTRSNKQIGFGGIEKYY
jgi:uncharacterized protein YdeI (YjbR/CyaY-like superfamily)